MQQMEEKYPANF